MTFGLARTFLCMVAAGVSALLLTGCGKISPRDAAKALISEVNQNLG